MKLLLVFSLLFTPLIVHSQATQTIRGTLTDQELGQPIIGATVELLKNGDLLKGVMTDENGEFKIEDVSVGRHVLRFSYLGYEERTLPDILVESGKQTVLEINMTESIHQLEEVVVKAEVEKNKPINELATVSARMFTVEESKRYAGSVDDPARMAMSFAGVTFEDDVLNSIVVRGNSPRGLLWRLEGIDIPNPNHFADLASSGGGISMLSSNMMTNSDFFTGAFPAEYGDATSGVFDINLRKGNNEKREYAFQLGALGTDFSMEGPFSKNYEGSYLLNYRYSTLALLNDVVGLEIVGDQVPKYQDLSFKLHLPGGDLGNFTLFGLGGVSVSEDEWRSNQYVYEDEAGYQSAIIGLTHNYLLNDKSYLKTSIAWTHSNILYDQHRQDTVINTGRDLYNEDYISTTQKLSVTYHHKFNPRHFIKTGVIGSRLAYDYRTLSFDPGQEELRTDLDAEDKAYMTQAFAAWKWRLGEQWTMNSGLHYLYFNYTGEHSVEPRIGVSWDFREGQQFSAGMGLHSKVENISVYTAERTLDDGSTIRPNENLGLSKAVHFVVGYDRMIKKDLHMKVEAYYQHLYDVPVYVNAPFESIINNTYGYTTDSLVNEGTGTNYGLELTLEKYFSRNYYFMFTGALYEAKYTALDGVERDNLFNGKYMTNLLAGKEFVTGKAGTNRFGASTRFMLSGGKRYTPVLLEASRQAGHTVRDLTRVYGEKLEDYWRIDLQLYYRINRSKVTHVIKLDAQNILNRLNVYDYYYDSVIENIEVETHTGIIPVLSYKIIF